MNTKQQNLKSLGALVPSELYYAFKEAAAKRQEQMQEAIINAAYLYIDAIKEKEGERIATDRQK